MVKESACNARDPSLIPCRKECLPIPIVLHFPGGSDGKESASNVGDLGSIPGLGRSPGEGYTLQYSCLENPHGQKVLVGYSPWGHKSQTRQVTKHTHQYIYTVF